MSYLDSPSWSDPPDRGYPNPAPDDQGHGSPGYGHDDPYPGRQRARHVDAAPDPYAGGYRDGDAELDLDLDFDRDRPARDDGAPRSGRRRAQPRRQGGRAMPDGDTAASTDPAEPAAWTQPAGWGDPGATAEIVGLVQREDDVRPADDVRRGGDDRSSGALGPGGDDATPAQAADVSAASPNLEPAKPRSRAGRNLPAAIGVGVTLGAIVVASLFPWRAAFLGVIALAVAIATWEMVRAVAASGARPPMVPLVAGGVAMAGLAWAGGAEALTLGLIATVVAAMVWRLADGPAGYQRDVVASLLIAVYVPFLGGFAALLLRPEDGNLRVLVAIAGVVLSDTGGYIFGVFLGKHPMAPSVSPKKSWEGFAGSLFATAVGGALLLHFIFDVPWWYGAVFGVAVSAASVLGDLAESLIKRDLGIKDMSTLLPGHGGLMDRLDSILFALPTAYAVLAIFASAAT